MAKLFDIIKIRKGKETVMMTDTLVRVNNRLDELRRSYRGNKAYSFRIIPSQEKTEKFEKSPSRAWRGYN